MAKSFNQMMKERFARITTSYDKANVYTHETAMLIVNHAKEHGDCSSAQGLVMALPASMRREMLILWFATFTPIVVKNSDDWEAKMHKPGSKLFVEWNLSGADEKPFYELAKDNKERPPLDDEGLLKLFAALGKRVEKMAEEGGIRDEYIQSALEAASLVKRIKFSKAQETVANNDDKSDDKELAA